MRYARAGGAKAHGIFRGGSLDICCPLVASLPCQKLSCQNFLLFYSDWCQPCEEPALYGRIFLPYHSSLIARHRAPNNLRSASTYTVDLEDKQLYFPVYIINFSEYILSHTFFGTYVHRVCSRFEFQVGHLNQRATCSSYQKWIYMYLCTLTSLIKGHARLFLQEKSPAYPLIFM